MQDLLKERELPISGLKADLVARLQENDAVTAANDPPAPSSDAPPEPTATAAPEPDAPASTAVELPTQTEELSDTALATKRAAENDEAAEHVKRMRLDHAAADAVPPASSLDSAIPPARAGNADSDVPKVGEETDVTPAVIAEAKVPVEAIARAANGSEQAGEGHRAALAEPLTVDDAAQEEPQRDAAEQNDFAQEDAEEEEEPPVYDFEPEEDSGRPADLYLDTVSFSTFCPIGPKSDPEQLGTDQPRRTRFRL